jgi:phosphoenolpyruvate carboxylase
MAKTPDLTRHTFYIAVLDNLKPLITRTRDAIPGDPAKLAEWREKNRATLTTTDHYVMQVFERANNLMHIINRLRRARYLLGRSPSAYKSRGLSFNRDDWSEYHFFVYTTSLASVLDCALLLSATVFRLGLPPRFCTFDIVTQHHWLAKSNLPKHLRSLKKSLWQHIERRHRYLHRGEESNIGELTDPDAFLYLRAATLVADAFHHEYSYNVEIPDPILSNWWRLELRQLRPLLEQSEKDVFTKVSQVLDSLQPVLNRQVHSFALNPSKLS